jgi:transcriptional regulator with XRE-family HTH domain
MARPKLSAAFGAVVRQHRTKRNLSQERLAEVADLHRNYVGMLERGECVATLDVADRIAQALGLNLEDLIGETRRRLEAGTLVIPRRRRHQ